MKQSFFTTQIRNSLDGFTLIELLVAIAIIALVTAIAIPNVRKYQTDQDLNDATNGLFYTLRLAQNNALSGVKCPSPVLSSLSWRVVINDPKHYTLQVECENPSGPPTTQNVNNRIPLSSNTNINLSYTCGLIVFDHNGVSPFSSGCGGFSDRTLTLTLTKLAEPPFYIKIDQGGSIYVSKTP